MRSGRIPVFLFEQQGTPSKSHNRASVVGIRCRIVSIAGDEGSVTAQGHRQLVLAPGKHPDRLGLLGFLTTKAMAEDRDFCLVTVLSGYFAYVPFICIDYRLYSFNGSFRHIYRSI